MDNFIVDSYKKKKEAIKSRLSAFKSLEKGKYFNEFLFCLLTPQSNAQKAWSAVNEISQLEHPSPEHVASILKSKTRFHNNKTKYVIEAYSKWLEIAPKLINPNIPELRNWLAENVRGYGLKEASHFLRNIGKSNNQIAILDRHILRNLKTLNVIEDEQIKNKAHYLKLEQKFLQFSKQINIPIDELDLLFWSKENGEIFK
jgi:N-glycosylase/DNA lyase